jgi:Flp pilus assembly protein TadG
MARLWSFPRAIASLWRDRTGVSAVEFSLLAPFLVVGTISAVDAGMAAHQQMMISQALRAGAHSAIAGQNETVVQTIIEAAAAENFTIASGPPLGAELSISVSTSCICPDAPTAPVTCTTSCATQTQPDQYYNLNAEKLFQGVILPDFNLSGTLSVTAP